MGAPLIGVTTSELRRSEDVRQIPQGEPPHSELSLGVKYVQAIAAAGGVPVVLPPLEPSGAKALVGQLAGLCLSGGPDLHPSSFGADPHPELGPTEPDADRFEIELVRLAWARDLPTLAICRGAQTLNVARGGTLFQHLPELPGATLEHRQKEPADAVTQVIEVEPGSLLAELAGTRLEVNSFHHQASDRVGHGLRVVGRSEDGVVEALEGAGRSFMLGVQWHAETLCSRPEQAALFEGLVETAAGGRSRARVKAA